MCVILTRAITMLCAVVMVLSACSNLMNRYDNVFVKTAGTGDENPKAVIAEGGKPKLRGESSTKPQDTGHITVAEASKVSDVELKAAVAKPIVASEQNLGKTIVSLGLLDQTGFWLQTPLVNTETEGRLVYADTGKSANVRLIPNGAVSGSGSQISIAAMRLLGIAITDIAEVQVFTR